MKGLKSRLPALIDRADKLSDSVRLRLRKITGFNNPLTIIPYLGYGSADKFLFAGRVLENEKFAPASSADCTWRNVINMYKRFETDEVPGARIRARFQGNESETTTDDEGYFHFDMQPLRFQIGRNVGLLASRILVTFRHKSHFLKISRQNCSDAFCDPYLTARYKFD